MRLRYGDLVTVLQSYLAAFSQCANGKATTVAIGTNNDGDYSPSDPYSPNARGADWAGSVINMLGSETGVTLVGANDIEPDFASTQKQAQTWETAYLKAATKKTLIFNGSADGCPDGFGDTGAACSKGFTQQGLYNLAHNDQGQIKAAPQVYSPSMAAQWANIDRTGGRQLASPAPSPSTRWPRRPTPRPTAGPPCTTRSARSHATRRSRRRPTSPTGKQFGRMKRRPVR